MSPDHAGAFRPELIEGTNGTYLAGRSATTPNGISSSIPRDSEPRQKRARRSLKGVDDDRMRSDRMAPKRNRADMIDNSRVTVEE
jgi:hypothetical protein